MKHLVSGANSLKKTTQAKQRQIQWQEESIKQWLNPYDTWIRLTEYYIYYYKVKVFYWTRYKIWVLLQNKKTISFWKGNHTFDYNERFKQMLLVWQIRIKYDMSGPYIWKVVICGALNASHSLNVSLCRGGITLFWWISFYISALMNCMW